MGLTLEDGSQFGIWISQSDWSHTGRLFFNWQMSLTVSWQINLRLADESIWWHDWKAGQRCWGMGYDPSSFEPPSLSPSMKPHYSTHLGLGIVVQVLCNFWDANQPLPVAKKTTTCVTMVTHHNSCPNVEKVQGENSKNGDNISPPEPYVIIYWRSFSCWGWLYFPHSFLLWMVEVVLKSC